MAGYDFSYCIDKDLRTETKNLLDFLKKFYKELELVLRYQTRLINGEVDVYVTVDGKLPLMQLADRNLLEQITHYLRVVSINQRNRKKIVLPLILSNREGLHSITRMVFDVAQSLNSIDNKTTVPPKVISSEMITHCDNSFELGNVYLSIVDNWYFERITNEQCIILVDQFIEDCSKHILGITNSNLGYREIVDMIVGSQDTHTIRDKFIEIHKTRNKVQHRGYKPTIDNANIAIDVGFLFINDIVSRRLP